MDFILGSSSPRRKELLSNLGIRYRIVIPDIEEIPQKGESPSRFVKRAAQDKLRAILKKVRVRRETVILTADTIVVLGKRILGKPSNKSEAYNMLKSLEGRWHRVYTAFCIYYRREVVSRVVKTDVRFRRLTVSEIMNYINTKEPMDKAGAYAAQGKGATIIKEIRGSYTNVVGLPMAELIEELKRLKVQSEF